MFYLSVCSGIEAATVAWEPLGFHAMAYAEIEKFPAAVLAHHYPAVPNLGDMTQIKGEEYRGIVDILVGGTPCQAFSVAGARKGLEDARGNLTLVFAGLADAIQPGFVIWENVPGVLSSKDNAFGCFLGLLAGEDDALVAPGGRWTDAGCVLGPERAIAWRVLDAQYFGLAQRRRRVFLVACPRDGADPREILFEREGLRRDSAPCRETGKGVAGSVAPCLNAGGNRTGGDRPYGMHADTCESLQVCHDVAPCLGASGRGVARAGETRGQDPVVAVVGGNMPQCVTGPITHALKSRGYAGSEDGTGREQPIVAFAQDQRGEIRNGEVFNTLTQNQYASERNTPMACFGGNSPGPIDVATARNAHAGPHGRLDFESETFCVHATQDPITSDVAFPLGCNQGQETAVFPLDLRNAGRDPEKHDTMNRQGVGVAEDGEPSHTLSVAHIHGVATPSQVRRLLPVECERLQGFPDGYTAIPWRNKAADQCPDGPRYKALGNSMAVPCMAWIGRRIQQFEGSK